MSSQSNCVITFDYNMYNNMDELESDDFPSLLEIAGKCENEQDFCRIYNPQSGASEKRGVPEFVTKRFQEAKEFLKRFRKESEHNVHFEHTLFEVHTPPMVPVELLWESSSQEHQSTKLTVAGGSYSKSKVIKNISSWEIPETSECLAVTTKVIGKLVVYKHIERSQREIHLDVEKLCGITFKKTPCIHCKPLEEMLEIGERIFIDDTNSITLDGIDGTNTQTISKSNVKNKSFALDLSVIQVAGSCLPKELLGYSISVGNTIEAKYSFRYKFKSGFTYYPCYDSSDKKQDFPFWSWESK